MASEAGVYAEEDLDAAVTAGVLSAQNVQAFRDFVARRQSTTVVDEEHFRLLTSFNDIFVAVAAILFLGAVTWLGAQWSGVVGPVLAAVFSWGFAEYFTRRRRMALPSIVLLLSFVGAMFFLGMAFWHGWNDANPGVAMLAGAALGGLSAYAHWRRFRVPVTVAAGTVAVLAGFLGLLQDRFPSLQGAGLWPVILVGGVIIFVLAMWWDASDRHRSTRRSDVAFWLHLVAAPAIAHPVFQALGVLEGTASALHAAMAVVIYLGLAVVALMVDRRALLISALIYVLYAISTLFKGSVAVNQSFGLTALVLGSSLLLLSASWHRARAVLVRRLPAVVQARLPAV